MRIEGAKTAVALQTTAQPATPLSASSATFPPTASSATFPPTASPATAPQTAILLVAPEPPPSGGMALQAALLARLLREDGNLVEFFPSNFQFRGMLGFLNRMPGIRTAMRALLIWPELWKRMPQVKVVHVLAASWLYFFTVVAPAAIAGKLRGKRVILNYRGGDADRFFRSWGWAVKPVLKAADAITVPSGFLADLIDRHFRLNAAIVNNILDSSAFRHRERAALRPRMLVARNLEKIYDVESVLRAFRAVAERHPDACLTIAGSGSQLEYLRSLAADWRLRNVDFLGHVAHRDLPGIYDQHDIFLNASRIDNFPGALLEASAAGLVVISTGAGGIPYMYRNGKDALLVEPGDWEGLAQAVETVLASPALARELSKAGAPLAASCDWRAVRNSLYSIYGAVIEEAPAREITC